MAAAPPLVLLHGLATTHVIWSWLEPHLPADRRVIALDVPGFGTAPPVGPGFALDAVADAVAAAIRAATPADSPLVAVGTPGAVGSTSRQARPGSNGPVDLVGHSMGGAVALTLADRHPDLVGRLVLVAPAGLRALPGRLVRAAAPLAAAGVDARRAAAPLARSPLARRLLLTGGVADAARISPAQARTMWTASRGATRVAAAFATVASADLRPAVARLAAPPGLIWGAQDRVVPPSVAVEVLRRQPAARLRVIPDAGHIAMVERPEAFAAALSELLP